MATESQNTRREGADGNAPTGATIAPRKLSSVGCPPLLIAVAPLLTLPYPPPFPPRLRGMVREEAGEGREGARVRRARLL
jgi:hypothetical protein